MIDFILTDNGVYIHVCDLDRVNQLDPSASDFIHMFYRVGLINDNNVITQIFLSSAVDLEIMGRYLDLKTFDCGMPQGTHKAGYVWLYDDNKGYKSHFGKAYDLQSAFNRRILEVVQERMSNDV